MRVYVNHIKTIIHKTKVAVDVCIAPLCPTFVPASLLTAEGMKPDEQKVEAMKWMPPPEDKKGTERLLGIVNYLEKFVPNMSTITKPIRELLRGDVEFQWGEAQEKAFQEVKDVLAKQFWRTMM